MNRSLYFWLFILSGMVLLAGCAPGENRVPAEGVLTIDGQPVDGASITVHYGDGNTAQGVTHDQGKFELAYLGKQGAVPGSKLKTSVTKFEGADVPTTAFTAGKSTPGSPDPAELSKFNQQQAQKMMEKTKDLKSGLVPKNELPEKFAKPETSGITVDIPAGGSKELKIDLKK